MEEYTSVEDQVFYGLDKIDADRKVEIGLRDLVLAFKTVEELTRFFHQPMHYSSLEDVQKYLGTTNASAFSLINKVYRNVLWNYLPEDIRDKLGLETTELVNPNPPYYYKSKS
jgi:hypothetical protein